MDKHSKSQLGFGVVGIVLIILAIGLVGGTSWYVWQQNKTKPAGAAENTPPNNKEDPENISQIDGQNVVKIPELEIQITVPDYAKDLVYEVGRGQLEEGNVSTFAIFSTESILRSKPDCSLVDTSFGSLGKVNGQYPKITDEGDNSIAMEYGILVKQFPTYYIARSLPNGGGDCQIYPLPMGIVEGSWKSLFADLVSSVEELSNQQL